MNSHPPSPDSRPQIPEWTPYILALLIALVVRLYSLGATPLSDFEAGWALQALHMARPGMQAGAPAIGAQPAYTFLTGVAFALLGSSNFLARFWPALCGALLVLLPYIFRRQLGRFPALILAFGLALDPGLVTASRLAGGPSMALSFALLALTLIYFRKPVLAGLLGGLALLSGPSIIPGALSLAGSWAILQAANGTGFRHRNAAQQIAPAELQPAPETQNLLPPRSLRPLLISLAATLLLLGTGFLRYPQGLAGWASALTTYLAGWANPSGVPAVRPIIALLVYEPVLLFLPLLGLGLWIISQSLGRERNGPPPLLILAWGMLGLILVLIYPARQVIDLVWVLVPLWLLAVIELGNHLPSPSSVSAPPSPYPASLVQAALILLLCGLFWNALIATQHMVSFEGVAWPLVRLGVLAGILGLGALTTILVGLGWSWQVSRNGLILGLMVAFTIYNLAAMWGAAHLRQNRPEELWSISPATGQAELLVQTLQDVSEQSTGFRQFVDIVSTVDAPSMRWVLRDFVNVRYATQPPASELPDVVITRQEQNEPTLAAAYRGQDFTWWIWPGWTEAAPPAFLDWLTFRSAPVTEQQVILWARSDLFPAAESEIPTSPEVVP